MTPTKLAMRMLHLGINDENLALQRLDSARSDGHREVTFTTKLEQNVVFILSLQP